MQWYEWRHDAAQIEFYILSTLLLSPFFFHLVPAPHLLIPYCIVACFLYRSCCQWGMSEISTFLKLYRYEWLIFWKFIMVVIVVEWVSISFPALTLTPQFLVPPCPSELHEVVVKIFPYEMGTLHFKTLASLAAMLHSKLKIAELAGWLTVNSEVTHFSWGLPHPLPHSSVTFRKLI